MFAIPRIECGCGFVITGPDTNEIGVIYADHECSYEEKPTPWYAYVFGFWGFVFWGVAAFVTAVVLVEVYAP